MNRRPARNPEPADPGKLLSPAALERAGLRYLERYAASAEQVRRVLRRRVLRVTRADDASPEQYDGAVETAVAALVARGLIDDAAYAEAAARSLRRRGASTRRLRAAMAAKGIDPQLAEAVSGGGDAAELAAAAAYARRRRLGPFRAAAERDERRARDLAAMARQGFALDIARAVIDGEAEPAE